MGKRFYLTNLLLLFCIFILAGSAPAGSFASSAVNLAKIPNVTPNPVYLRNSAPGSGTFGTLTISSLLLNGTTAYTGTLKAHLHVSPCAYNYTQVYGNLYAAGGHWKSNTSLPSLPYDESNELWWYFDFATSYTGYNNGGVLTSYAANLGSVTNVGGASSVVIHQNFAPTNPKWFCCDLTWTGNSASCNTFNPISMNTNLGSTQNDTVSASVTIVTGAGATSGVLQGIVDIGASSLTGNQKAFASSTPCNQADTTAAVYGISPSVAAGTVTNELYFVTRANSTSGAAHFGTGRSFVAGSSPPASIVVQNSTNNLFCCDLVNAPPLQTTPPATTPKANESNKASFNVYLLGFATALLAFIF